MSETFEYITRRASGERQIIRKSQFSKDIFYVKNASKGNDTKNHHKNGAIIICM
ncbi:hypothetical protein J2128_001811 [Methanomicrobium sp. W14]|uniref:hypothetical protein n=1 Tax=Methanomicrobium sp. W14 TaxID=2817839 RepID=UPI001AE58527|nr:hypothetical protein [Methanomicrobium sp. W14]MBP2133857.1 hypothetical protein [Methanomicrobium sp. W14]